MKKITFVGDISFSGDYDLNKPKFDYSLLDSFFEDHVGDDLLIGNLETVFTNSNVSIEKYGPSLRSSPSCAAALDGFDFLSLANNHCNDFGLSGLRETRLALSDAGCDVMGVIFEESDYSVVEVSESIFVIAGSEREFNLYRDYGYGAQHFDVIDLITKIRDVKAQNDRAKVILFLHAGIEFYNLPSPGLVKKARTLVDFGADAVVFSHTHVVGPTEIYKGAPICYGLGNFLFPSSGGASEPGMVATLNVAQSEIELEIDFVAADADGRVGHVCSDEKVRLLQEVTRLSDIVLSEQALVDNFDRLLRERGAYYRNTTFLNVVFPGVHRLVKYFRLEGLSVPTPSVARRLNMISCESHHEVISASLRRMLK